MAKNITLDIIDRLDKLEKQQQILAEARVLELASEGITVTVEEVKRPNVTARQIREKPTGLLNGVNKVFTLKNAACMDSDEVYINGIQVSNGSTKDYTISGNTVTTNYALESDDDIRVSYDFIVVE